tara:strand:+ start:481 stop:2325 length:1845 start_codon:yes stop_codon:yes gene_type:complete
MKTKRGIALLLILTILFTSTLVLADNHTEEDTGTDDVDLSEIEQAYSCLKNKLGDDCANSNSIEQLSFSLLAMGYDEDVQKNCKDALIAKEEDDSWDDDNIKLTAQAILALNHVAVNVDPYIEWLLTKAELTDELNWFLQIDAENATTCEIRINEGSARDFNIAENKKVSGTSSCLSPASSEQNYYLEIDDDCFDDEFTISCNKDFITSVFYKKPGSSIYYVSSATHSAPSDGETKEKINSYCFADSSSADCDYESTLWAALALAKAGEETSSYIPYLSAEAEDNREFLPSAFLYILTNDDDYYTDLVEQQKQGKYWEESGNQKFYDTALALLALQETNVDAEDNTKEYLLDIQDSSGCWHSDNVLETAFLLFAGWPKNPAISGSSTRGNCEPSFSCVASSLCTSSDTLDSGNYYCPGIGDACCRETQDIETCAEKQGTVCSSGQECTQTEIIAKDTNYCCQGDCQLVLTGNACETSGYECKSTCSSGQEEKTAYSIDCDFGDICCDDKESKSSLGLIILLIILIILVVLAIIFREQVKIWFFRIKSKFKFGKGPKSTPRPPMPPESGIPQFNRPRQIIPRQPTRRLPPRRIPRRKTGDSVFDDTMKKLKDMTK